MSGRHILNLLSVKEWNCITRVLFDQRISDLLKVVVSHLGIRLGMLREVNFI